MDNSWQVRIGSESQDSATVYVRKHSFVVGKPLQFDVEYEGSTAVECLLGAFGSDICNGFLHRAKKKRLDVDGIEATVEGVSDNPLTYLGVVGEDGHPGLTAIKLRAYINTLCADAEVQDIWDETVRLSPLVRTMDKQVDMDLSFKIAF